MHSLQTVRLIADARQAGLTQTWKRPLDLTVGLLALLVASPILLLVAALIKLTSRGSVFFVQTRIGKNGQPFKMYKFRSMHVDAEARRAALLAQSDRQGICFKSKNDPRITPIGRWLRRLSLDELPQILNVITGDMSLVGPRPALPQEVAAYPARARLRLQVLPGITGLWQVSGRAEIGFDDMIEMDIQYARNGGLMTDLSILLRTFGAVFSGRGAY
jgi:exopolysaccharide biosynthesis polyprenyl glycosylphosphotransferase